MFTQIVRLSFVDLRWAQLYVSLVFDKVADAECCFPFFAKFSPLVVCHRSITDSLFLDTGIENKLSAESSVLWKKRSEHFTRFTFLYEWGIMLAQKMWEILFIMSCSLFIPRFLSCFVRWGVRTLPPMVFVSPSVRSYFGSDVSVWHVSKPREKCACWK